jgi:hypothetical protein
LKILFLEESIMNKRLNRMVSIFSVCALMGMLYSPGLSVSAAEKNSTTNLQVQKEALSKALANDSNYHVKINSENKVEVYTDAVAKINASAKAASGLEYGDWFGGADSYYSTSPSEDTRAVLVLFAIFNPFISSSSVALKVAQSISGTLGLTMTVTPGQTLAADRTKRYREVTYSDGSFAYWQTKIGASVSLDDDYYGYGETIISGGQW